MDLDRTARWWPAGRGGRCCCVVAALAAAQLAPAAQPRSRRPPTASRPCRPSPVRRAAPRRSPARRDPTPADRRELPEWVAHGRRPACVGAASLVAVGCWSGVAARRARRRQGGTPPREPRPTAEAQPRRGGGGRGRRRAWRSCPTPTRDPRRAVIACWVRLEQAAAAAGTPRQPGDSPTDLVTRLLARARGSSAGRAGRLRRRSTARPGTPRTPVDDRMRDQARAALRRLRAELHRVAGAAAAA